MAVALSEDFNVFVGAKTGILKGLSLFKGAAPTLIQNIPSNLRTLSQEKEITSMAWTDQEESGVMMGLADQTVQTYDPAKGRLKSIKAECGEGPIVGVAKFNEDILTGAACGTVRLWSSGSGKEVQTGGPLERLRRNGNLVATGGKKNDLKLWDAEAEMECTFKAKNVPNDWLQLEVPVWVSDIAFVPNSDKIVVSTRHGHVRIYDPKAQRRPVMTVDVPEKALTAVAVGPSEGFVLVGTATGQIFRIDVRQKGMMNGHYKGSKGSVREVICVDNHVFSVSLDRHFRVHAAESRKLIKSEYLKSKLSCLLVKSDFKFNEKEEKAEVLDENEIKIEPAEAEMDEIFGEMETVDEPKKKRGKITITDVATSKKKKKLRSS